MIDAGRQRARTSVPVRSDPFDPAVMTTRRAFLGSLGLPALAPLASLRFDPARESLDALPVPVGTPEEVARDEDFWSQIAAAFEVDRSMINFNNGGVSPAPRSVTAALARHLAHSNQAPAYVMWQLLQPNRESVRRHLASFMRVDAEAIAITRNASEGLEICQLGLDLSRGDEVLCTDQDDPRMIMN